MNNPQILPYGTKINLFPSPTGVNYYEYKKKRIGQSLLGFRPQQGSTIMNNEKVRTKIYLLFCFRPQQGSTIMNGEIASYLGISRQAVGFRPQQGSTIMNLYPKWQANAFGMFPSPTGVNYYECLQCDLTDLLQLHIVSVPNRGQLL